MAGEVSAKCLPAADSLTSAKSTACTKSVHISMAAPYASITLDLQ